MTARMTGVSCVLAVPDLAVTMAWWVNVMGFRLAFETEGWAFLERNSCRLRLGECRDALPPAEIGDHSYFAYVQLDDVDGFQDEIAAKGAEILRPATSQPWGMREMAVRTPDGHRIMFAQAMNP